VPNNVVAVAFVAVRFVKMAVVPDTLVANIFVPVADVKFRLVVVAFVAVKFVTLKLVVFNVPIVALGVRSSVDDTSPKAITFPELDIENLVELFTCKFTKSPLYPAEGLAPKNVPDALPPWMILLPKRKRDEVEAVNGVPDIWRVEVAPPAAFAKIPPSKVCKAVHVGAIACERAGAASLLMKVLADPFWAERVIETLGLAPVEVE
jgi:hypothetical protein